MLHQKQKQNNNASCQEHGRGGHKNLSQVTGGTGGSDLTSCILIVPISPRETRDPLFPEKPPVEIRKKGPHKTPKECRRTLILPKPVFRQLC